VSQPSRIETRVEIQPPRKIQKKTRKSVWTTTSIFNPATRATAVMDSNSQIYMTFRDIRAVIYRRTVSNSSGGSHSVTFVFFSFTCFQVSYRETIGAGRKKKKQQQTQLSSKGRK
jgi:hypothetical protein